MMRKEFLKEYKSGRRDFCGVNLAWVDLAGADLVRAKLVGADLVQANLVEAKLVRADLTEAKLVAANLAGADLTEADLTGANLAGVNLLEANLSGAKGLISSAEFMAQFETDEKGWLVPKVFGLYCASPEYWAIEPGSFIEEVCNPCRTNECGSGISFSTPGWVLERASVSNIWRCRIHFADGPGIVVPYNTDGKARCERMEILGAWED